MVAYAVIYMGNARVISISGCRMADLNPADFILVTGIRRTVNVKVKRCYIPVFINLPGAVCTNRFTGHIEANIRGVTECTAFGPGLYILGIGGSLPDFISQ